MAKTIEKKVLNTQQPDEKGFFGNYGGAYLPPSLVGVMQEITDSYMQIKDDPAFVEELTYLQQTYSGRPSPVYYAKRLSEAVGGAKIYLKREDLNHTGAHKINHCLGEVLLAKRMGKKKVIAETGAGQHGVALATAAALLGLECDIYMGDVDVAKQAPNVRRMQVLGAKVVPVSRGTRTLKDAVDAAFEAYLQDPVTTMYAIGSVVGPHPFPMMVRDFQSVVGREARQQFLDMTGSLPNHVVACVGGGSNAIGIFSGFLDDPEVDIIGVEPGGRGPANGDNAATMTYGTPGIIHGFSCYLLQDKDGEPLPVYSIASGLDYPGVGPQHCYLKDIKRVKYEVATDRDALVAFYDLSRLEGIIPALESAHAIGYAIKVAAKMSPEQTILVNLSGRGDKDMDYVMEHYPLEAYEEQKLLVK
ncbi:MAG: tryptophan synthase subunit beta [Sphaerochaeta sp.]|jgi:tryptophan synthase beta chain|nr:tryptophan synthase subunit beta [Sphaerochaeta sp.]PKL28762.1 MAG: tryptophan synthase subunit beta [Spirochaetae bacterium HGW-Spirochaetae-2]